VGDSTPAWAVESLDCAPRPQVAGRAVRGGRRSGAWVQLVSNETPMSISSQLRRSGRLAMGLGGGSPPIEDI
jgi:hypothetical protein